MANTTIQINKTVLNSLKSIKKHPRQSYNEVISHLIKKLRSAKKDDCYDEFLHKAQQHKMKELWDNKEDEAWENA